MPSIPGRAPCTSHEIRIPVQGQFMNEKPAQDRKSTRLNSSHSQISYAVFCLKKKKNYKYHTIGTNEPPPVKHILVAEKGRVIITPSIAAYCDLDRDIRDRQDTRCHHSLDDR